MNGKESNENESEDFTGKFKRFSRERFMVGKKGKRPVPYDPAQDRPVERKVSADFSNFPLEKLLEAKGVVYTEQVEEYEWLPLQHFDYKYHETVHEELWPEYCKSGRFFDRVQGKKPTWTPIHIIEYCEEKEIYRCESLSDGKIKRLPRIRIFFDKEDPENFAERFRLAHTNRIYSFSLLKLQHFIGAMPAMDSNELSVPLRNSLEKRVRIYSLTSMDLSQLFHEISEDYSLSMNLMMLQKYMVDYPDELVPHGIVLPPKVLPPVPKYGIKMLEQKKGAKDTYMHNYNEVFEVQPKLMPELFKEFCFQTILINEEVVIALNEIREETLKLSSVEIFLKSFNKFVRIDEFKQLQDTTITSAVHYLRNSWIPNIFEVIKKRFSSIEHGWFSFKEGRENYEEGKFKRFMNLVKNVMSDELLFICQKEFHNYVESLKIHEPSKVVINSPLDVENLWEDRIEVKPIFILDLLKATNSDNFVYSAELKNFVRTPLAIFDKALDDLSRIPDPETRVISELLKVTKKRESFLNSASRTKLETFHNILFNNLYKDLNETLERCIKPLTQYQETFEEYKEVLTLNSEEYIKEFEEAELSEIKAEIDRVAAKEKDLKEKLPDYMRIGIFQVKCKDLVSLLSGKYVALERGLKDILIHRARKETAEVNEKILEIQDKLKENPKEIESLVELNEFIETIPMKLDQIWQEIRSTIEIYDMMESMNVRIMPDDIHKRWTMFGGPKDTMDLISNREKALEREKERLEKEMKESQKEFKENLETLDKTIQGFSQYKNMDAYDEVARVVKTVNDSLAAYSNEAKKFNNRENLFGHELTDYSKLNKMSKEFTPYSTLWLNANSWFKNRENWLYGDWENVDAPGAEKFVEESLRSLSSVVKHFKEKDLGDIQKMAEKVKGQIDEFRPKVPLLVALKKPGMKERHWEAISEKLGFKISPEQGFTFTTALDLGLMDHIETCVQIGERAAKEFQIEKMLNEMIAKWEEINFSLLPFKNTFIIRGYDEIQAILDEHIINTQTMQFSPFKKPFEEKIMNWYNQLKLNSDILEEWAKVQMNWMYLQPIFDSQDISKQLPGETRKFRQVDTAWKQMIGTAKSVSNVLKVCQTEGLLEKLNECFQTLEMITKELNNYLERKRERFARFYFLSNDDLLEILSQTKEPTAVQPHLRKVFENIFEVEFTEDKRIIAMMSAEGEKVPFTREIDPINKNVEDWMTELENMMMESVRDSLLKSIKSYPNTIREEWVLNFPGQCVLNGSQMHWTKEVEESFAVEEGNGVDGYLQKLNGQLDNLVELVRTQLTKKQQVTINALIVIDVHARDVVDKLVQQGVNDKAAFEWISQLRYYWENDDCFVKCIQTNFPYGYEYLGNTLRLVITPLTDICYITLMGALRLNLGGAPAGPAGTGKTESTKDLAKALAKKCVVFNCSSSMNYIMIGKFFKGLASSGAWCCFDEFNRINIEVLSVIAQQLLILFGEKGRGSDRVFFEGSDIKLLPTFSVFITMNPGYAGRTELPDNLKALFRSVAMMVPNYSMIGEIMLYSFGFKSGRDLARKMVATFKLSSEQLSSQCHYDYGMRAVRSVINAAGLLKSQFPEMNEDQLLLRALRDVNIPKFLKNDLPLFENIIRDLFPGVSKPVSEYGKLMDSIKKTCEEKNLQTEAVFLEKVIQLYDTIQVRHGLMLVGPTGGGKTSNYKVLQASMTKLHNKGQKKVHTHILNPKAITMGQLYGEFNEQTHEWSDGILAYIVRETVKDMSGELHWVVFDGPVDSLWIESMNTVLDDNKKLCLSSGQILTLTSEMTMMFEVENLDVASPATVSRCGMVYLEPVALGWRPLLASWIVTLPSLFQEKKTLIPKLNQLFNEYIDPILDFIRKQCKEIQKTMDGGLLQSQLKLLSSLFVPFIPTEERKVTPEDIDNLDSMIEEIFLFSLLWSVCATIDHNSRAKLDVFLKEKLVENKATIFIPEEGTLYDYCFLTSSKSFIHWSDQIKNFEVDQKLGYAEIVVPTTDSTRNNYFTKLLLTNNVNVLCPGPTGTGKTQNIMQLLTSSLDEMYQYIALSFSAQTSANQTQDTIDSKLDRRRKGYHGPPIGKKCIIFVDDLNMPKKEEFFAQPPIEILRQFMDHRGWYNRKEMYFQNLEDLVILAAMGPPEGGRSNITARIIRHFNVIAYTELENSAIKQIFTVLVSNFLKKFSEPIRALIPELITSVMTIFQKVRAELLPTPTRSHYTFNLRDIWKVFQGICQVSHKHCSRVKDLTRLWYHENMRVFHDRLINDEDRKIVKGMLADNFTVFGVSEGDVFEREDKRIIFVDFLDSRDSEDRPYREAPELKQFLPKMEEFLEEYNTEASYSASKKQMKLVLFADACEHVTRIERILRLPQGHALLLGVGGSGRQSLSKLSTFLAGYKLSQIEVTKNYTMKSWREDLKMMLLACGLEDKPLTFLIVDTQIFAEQMLEDINSILNSGDVANLYQEKEMEEIINTCKSDCIKKSLQPNKMNIFAQFLTRVKRNIHVILAMSPLSEKFTTHLRMFPSLVNCCTIDWFTEWPEEALIGVGKGAFSEVESELGIEKELNQLVECFKIIHKSVEKSSLRFHEELRRSNYVTPISYLEQLTLYKQILVEKREDLSKSIGRLKGGLEKLEEANAAVEAMQEELKIKQPELEKAQIETEETMKVLSVEKAEADAQQALVARQEEEASKQAAEAMELARNAEESVAEANKLLDETLAEVQKLKKDHLVEIKTVLNPVNSVRVTLGGLVILNMDFLKKNNYEIVMKPDPDPKAFGKKVEDYFETAKRYLLKDPQELLNMLLTYDKDKINPAYIKKLEQKILPDPDFTYERASDGSFAVKFLYSWVRAMYDFYNVYTKTQPLRNELARVQVILDEKTKELNMKKEALAIITKKINDLTELYENKIKLKEQLAQDIAECEVKLDRAQKLTAGLKDERHRWSDEVQELIDMEKFIPGNSLIAAGMVAYAGPFTPSFRSALEKKWIEAVSKLGLYISEGISMRNFLGIPVVIQQWNLAGLPKDDTSVENGIIIEKSRRCPLCIDPQNQANKFIKNMGRDRAEGIEIMKINEQNLIRTIEKAIQFGQWVLLENVGKYLDPSLEPILNQQIVKQGASKFIIVGEKQITFDDRFKLFLTTTLPNPHYSPEISAKVTIINFAITPEGLEDQMMAQIVAIENPQLEQKKNEIVRRNAQDKKELLAIEDSILMSLSETKGDISEILSNETIINKLQTSKKFATEIQQRVEDSKVFEKQIDAAREDYRAVAFRASLLFFTIVDLSNIDPMYQYSLQWFTNLFIIGCENAPVSNVLASRLEHLNSYFTFSLYENICRSLFESHKLLFSFLLAIRILGARHEIEQEEWRYLLMGPVGEIQLANNPSNWIAENSWPDIYRNVQGTASLSSFSGFLEYFLSHIDEFKPIYDSQNPETEPLPGEWDSKLNSFQKMIVVKCIRPGKLIPAVQNWISEKLGKEYIISPPFDLGKCFNDSSIMSPLIFILSPGSDPIADFMKFAEENGMNKRMDGISLGQGQGIKAEKMIKEYAAKGGWVLLQNCHLAISWMPELERICEDLNENLHKDFRLWLTSVPDPSFPISVLQNGVKMTLEPPKGLRNNLFRSYKNIGEEELEDCKKPREFKKFLFAFCLFHAIVQERRRFGPIGWNIPYAFTNEDLTVCKRQLKLLLDEYEEIPYKVINYLGAVINYGGRVTDSMDVRLIKAILENYINPNVLEDGHNFSVSGVYKSIPAGSHAEYLTYISSLPLNPAPEAFGLHDNAEITTAQSETRVLLETLLSIQPRSANASGKSREEAISETIQYVEDRTAEVFDFEAVYQKYPTLYEESMNTVLVQEVIRFNRLLEVMKITLYNARRAIKGLIVMDDELEALVNSIFDNQVPQMWADKGFLSLKPLSSWIADLNSRVSFLKKWIDEGTPNAFWISGLFFPQAFITGTLQNFARKYQIAIDELNFEFKVIDNLKAEDVTEKPEDGCYIYGMFCEGARWCYDSHQLVNPIPKELFSDLPMLWCLPIHGNPESSHEIYNCPLYKVVSRTGELSTTGHSTNFVMSLEFPCSEEEKYWVKAGVAAFLSLRY